jgi:hypothetical protein
LGRLKRTIYARMEQMSFRSGVAVLAGVPVAAGVAITLALALGGHGAAVPSAPRPAAVARPTLPPSPVVPTASPSATARPTPAASLMPANGYQLHAPVTVVTTTQASAAWAAGLPTWRFPRPGRFRRPWPAVPGLGWLSSLNRSGAPEWRHGGRPDWDGKGLPGWRRGPLRHGPRRAASASRGRR